MVLTPLETSAKKIVENAMAEWGLTALGSWAWTSYLNGAPLEQIKLDVRDRPEYAVRFAGMEELRKKGRAINEATYIDLERGYASVMRAFLPATFYDGPEDFAKMIAGEKSVKELNDQLEMYSRVAAADPRAQRLREALSGYYGMGNSDALVLSWFIDMDKGADLIQKQYGAASAAAAAAQAGFDTLTKAQAERVGAGRYSDDYLTGQFGKLASMDEFLTDVGGTGSVTRDDLIGAGIEGNQDAAAKVEGTAKKRVAAFQSGGGYASGQGGVGGLGSAAT